MTLAEGHMKDLKPVTDLSGWYLLATIAIGAPSPGTRRPSNPSRLRLTTTRSSGPTEFAWGWRLESFF